MPKESVFDYSTTAGSNEDIDGVDLTGATGLVKNGDNYVRSLMSHLRKFANDLGAVNTVGGTGDAITVTLASGIAAYATGQVFRFTAGADNAGATTINVNAIGAKAIRKISGGADVALVAGDILDGKTYLATYDAAANSAAGAFIIDPGATVNLGTDIGPAIAAAAGKTTPVDADMIAIADSAATNATKKVTLTNSWANYFKAKADALYPALTLLTTRGDIIYRGASTWARLAKGTSGQVLTMGANDPAWAAVETSSMTLLGTLTTTSGNSHALTGIAAGYRQFMCELDGVSLNIGGTVQLELGSGSTSYGTAGTVWTANSGPDLGSGFIIIGNVSSTIAAAKIAISVIVGAAEAVIAIGAPTGTAAVATAVRFTTNTTFDAGSIRIYGVK
jgi:hypothetical protein